MTDMTIDFFAEQAFGKAALKKMGEVPENFRLYYAGWVGPLLQFKTMKVIGAEFRHAKKGPNAGKLSIKVPYTTRVVYVTSEEIEAVA